MSKLNTITHFAAGLLDNSQIGLPEVEASPAKLTALLMYFFGLIAAISFLMIVIGGFRYVISIGDPQKITTARKTITYSVIGLIISLSALAIVGFVISVATK